MNYSDDKRIVMTLDAGGTNFVFSAVQGNKKIVDEIILPSYPDDLNKSLSEIVKGFVKIKEIISNPSAISFAFPGPADYPNGIIYSLPNLPAFQDGVALGSYLKQKFNLPVYINNDGNLFAYGEALAGFLPYINKMLEKSGSIKRFKNLLGLTIGTGFGAGIVIDGKMLIGDNSIAGEIWLLRNKLNPDENVEEHVSIRGIRKIYSDTAGINLEDTPSPKEIYEIGIGNLKGNKAAALKAFKEMAEAAGDAVANTLTLIDGLVVIGGGLSGASELFLPHLINEMNSCFKLSNGKNIRRLASKVYNLEDENELQKFFIGSPKNITVPGTENIISYDSEMRTGVGISILGTSNAVAIGAYNFALSEMDK